MVSKETSSITEINQKGVYSGFIGRRLYGTIRYNKSKELLRFGTLQANAQVGWNKKRYLIGP